VLREPQRVSCLEKHSSNSSGNEGSRASNQSRGGVVVVIAVASLGGLLITGGGRGALIALGLGGTRLGILGLARDGVDFARDRLDLAFEIIDLARDLALGIILVASNGRDSGGQGGAIRSRGAVDGGKGADLGVIVLIIVAARSGGGLTSATGLATAVLDGAASGLTVGASGDGNTSTTANLEAKGDHLLGLILPTDGSGAVTDAVDEVLVEAQAAEIVLVASQLLCLIGTKHIGGAKLTALGKAADILGEDGGGDSAESEESGLHFD